MKSSLNVLTIGFRVAFGNAVFAMLLGTLLPQTTHAADPTAPDAAHSAPATGGGSPSQQQTYSYRDGFNTDLVNGLASGALGAAASLHPAPSAFISDLTQSPIYKRPVLASLMTDTDIDAVMKRIESSPGRRLGVGNLGGASVELNIDQAALKQVLTQRNVKFLSLGTAAGGAPTSFTATAADYQPVQVSLRGMPDSEVRNLLVGLKEAGVTVENIGFRNIAGEALVKVTAVASVTTLISGASKLLHSGFIALNAPVNVFDSAKSANVPMVAPAKPKFMIEHFYSDAMAKARATNSGGAAAN